MSEQTDQTDSERHWLAGERVAYNAMLGECLRHLGYDSPEATKSSWVREREEAIVILRGLCADHGDNDWDEHLHLADVIDKHLGNYLREDDPMPSFAPTRGATVTGHLTEVRRGTVPAFEEDEPLRATGDMVINRVLADNGYILGPTAAELQAICDRNLKAVLDAIEVRQQAVKQHGTYSAEAVQAMKWEKETVTRFTTFLLVYRDNWTISFHEK